jgi:arginine utilization regulatory protein
MKAFKLKKPVPRIKSYVYEKLLSYNWPGNVRELKNVIESAFCNNHEAIIGRNDLPNYIIGRLELEDICKSDAKSLSLDEIMARYEVLLIRDAYERNNGSLTKTADELHISKQNLAYKMKKYELR